jgi:arylsulfatase A-like enzyme
MALAFIERNRSQPFFCYVPFTIPHLELLVPEDSIAKYRGKFPERAYVDPRKHYADQPEVRATYAGMIDRLDRDVGRITSLIGKLGLDNDTIVFFTSDNGAATPLYNEHYFNSTAGLRGHKQNLYEGGIRVPMIARWKGTIAARQASAHTWYFADFLPTAAALAGAQTPSGLDGISVAPTLVGEKAAGRRQQSHAHLYWELPRHDAKTGTFRRETPMQALRMGEWKAVRPVPDGALELYHLRSDPGESNNVAAEQPGVMKRIESILARVRTEPRAQREPEDGWYGKRQPA